MTRGLNFKKRGSKNIDDPAFCIMNWSQNDHVNEELCNEFLVLNSSIKRRLVSQTHPINEELRDYFWVCIIEHILHVFHCWHLNRLYPANIGSKLAIKTGN